MEARIPDKEFETGKVRCMQPEASLQDLQGFSDVLCFSAGREILPACLGTVRGGTG